MDKFDYLGFVNGTIQTIVGHPLDTLKTWKQSNEKINLNIRNLYLGLSYPLLTNSILNHIQFNLINLKSDNIHYNYLATGIFSGLFLAPIEYFKIRKQNNLKIKFPNGFLISIIREVPGVYIYFGIINNFKSYTKIDSEILTGGTAGVMAWLLTYPLDTIKTKIQSDIKFSTAIKQPYFNGLSFCLYRAFIANSLGYFCYVKLKELF